MTANTLPQSLRDNPRLSRWIEFLPPDQVRLSTGKVEIGQGVLTALAQIAAEELDVGMEQMRVRSGQTGVTPEEGLTVGSFSIEMSGAAIRIACAEIRQLFLAHAAARLGAPGAALAMKAGKILRDGGETGLDYWALAREIDLDRDATGAAPTKRPADYRIVGRDAERLDLRAKVTGAAFLHDLVLKNMLHARVLHPPRRGASLAAADLDCALQGRNVAAVRERDFLALLSEDESALAPALEAVQRVVRWEGGAPLDPALANAHALAGMESTDTDSDLGPAPPASAPRVSATYSKPYLAHASIAPSCGLARYEDGKLTIWTHSQGVGPLGQAIAAALGLDPANVAVIHMQGAGCYGHNGADDAAFEAALIAVRRPGAAIRVQWTRADELASSPFGPAMVVKVEAALGPNGRPVGWEGEIWSALHAMRPGRGASNLLSDESLKGPPPPRPAFELPIGFGGAATRNAAPTYAFPTHRVRLHLVQKTPLRTSSMRGLGAFANVFAIECFMDELALRAGEDPVAFRLACTEDPRARRVIETAADMAAWGNRPAGGDGAGLGFAYSRYKGSGAYLAAAAEVEVSDRVRVKRVWCAVDVGLAISPDGVRNQVEGGAIQAASWALLEEVRFADDRVATASWRDYPILRFADAPAVEAAVVGSRDDPPIGVGEAATGPTGAAIGNAVAHALGRRIRDLPFTRERLAAALSA
jgi:CO/xanthine dehydrogenase Mo-binding subunit